MSAPLWTALALGWLAAAGFGWVRRGARERRRSELLARAAHELRAPLGVMLLQVDLWTTAGPARSELPRRAVLLRRELERGLLALDDLQEAIAGRMARRATAPRDSVDLQGLVRGLVEARAAIQRPGAIELDWRAGPAVVRGDPLRLEQALANLVQNALEHGGGRAALRAEAVAGRVRITVSDWGPGLPAPLTELQARSCGRHGHGLAVAVAACEAHGGSLRSAPARCGARLVLELPMSRPGTEGSAAA